MNPTDISGKTLSLETLRAYHYQESQRARSFQLTQETLARSFVRNKAKQNEACMRAKAFDDIANFHLKAVQALNDVCEGSVHGS